MCQLGSPRTVMDEGKRREAHGLRLEMREWVTRGEVEWGPPSRHLSQPTERTSMRPTLTAPSEAATETFFVAQSLDAAHR